MKCLPTIKSTMCTMQKTDFVQIWIQLGIIFISKGYNQTPLIGQVIHLKLFPAKIALLVKAQSKWTVWWILSSFSLRRLKWVSDLTTDIWMMIKTYMDITNLFIIMTLNTHHFSFNEIITLKIRITMQYSQSWYLNLKMESILGNGNVERIERKLSWSQVL